MKQDGAGANGEHDPIAVAASGQRERRPDEDSRADQPPHATKDTTPQAETSRRSQTNTILAWAQCFGMTPDRREEPSYPGVPGLLYGKACAIGASTTRITSGPSIASSFA